MISFRICNIKYKNSIDGIGAKLFGGRWNTVGVPMLYTTEHISLAALEILVNINHDELPDHLTLIKFSFTETKFIKTIEKSKLKTDWKFDIAYTRFIGDSFIKDNTFAILKTPSAVIDDEYNYLLNPLHKHFTNLKILSNTIFEFDKRLFLQK